MDQRILGALLEKQVTVPATYPLSLNSLRTACNQTSSRDPISEYDDEELMHRCRELKDRGLVRIVWADTGRRTLKYHQALDQLLELDEAERAILTVLLLRGPSAPGELRTRTDRLHPFADRGDVETTLEKMAARGLVQQLDRRPGDRDHRWVHLFSDLPTPPVAPPVDTTRVLADGGAVRDDRVRAGYAAVAQSYHVQVRTELEHRPFERWLLERLADLAGPHPVVDAGCGTGHVTAFLDDLGVDVTGVDLSEAMVAQARAAFPSCRFRTGDLRELMRPANDDGWGAAVAHYSLVHLTDSELRDAIGHLVRVLRPGGWLLVGDHVGPEVRHLDQWWDTPVDLDFVLHDPVVVRQAFLDAGLTDVEWWIRGRDETAGESSDRFYALGRKA